MNRRHFIGSMAAAGAARHASGGVQVDFIRPRSPYEDLLRNIDPSQDRFACEKEAAEIAARLKQAPETHSLPFAPGLTGVSPLPARYNAVAEGVARAEYDSRAADVSAGLAAWFDSLGPIDSIRFFVLPANAIRFEISTRGKYRTGHWIVKWAEGRVVEFAPVEEMVTSSDTPLFREITGHAFEGVSSFHDQLRLGIPAWRARLDAASGIDVHGHNGIAVGDIDNDGTDEIYICQPGGLPNRLYRNRGVGRLEDITGQAGVGILDATSSALFADFRNSGHQDLVVLRPSGPLFFLNNGAGRFDHKPGAFRFANEPRGSFTGMAAADYDRDGKVDLYLCTYSFFRDGSEYRYPAPYYDAQNGPANFLFRNRLEPDGEGQFTDVTDSAGLGQNNNRFSFAPAWCDYDGDGWPDLYVANDFGRKNLYKNEHGRFRDVAAEAGVEDIGDGMSASWFDYDGDGRPDLCVSNMWSDAGQRIAAAERLQPREAWRRHAKGNSLYRNRGDGTFEETGATEGVEMGRWAWASDGIDFDNDGAPEIFIAAGMLTNESETDLESFFWRRVAAASPSTAAPDEPYENGWNALSQAVHGSYSEAGRQPNVFYVRRGGRYHDFSGVSGLDFAGDSRAFAVTDLDGDGNPDLIVKNRLGPQVRVFQNNCAAGRKAIAFRLRGVRSNRDAIGARIEVDGQVKFLNAGCAYLSQHTKVLHFGLGKADSARTVTITWPSGGRQEFRDLAAGFRYEIEEGSAHPHVTPFAPPVEFPARPVTGDNAPHLKDTWLLKPVPLPEPSSGPTILKLSNLSAERAEWYALLVRYLFDVRADLKLPAWLLVDGQNRAHKVYFSPPDVSDLRRLKDPNRLALALPFAGRYYAEPERNYGALGAAFFAAGYAENALAYLAAAPPDNAAVAIAIGKIHLQAGRWDAARAYLKKGIGLAPDSADAWNSLGAAEMGAGSVRAGLNDFEKALAIRPRMVPAMINAAQAQSSLGDRAGAEKMFRRAVDLDPGNPSALNLLGELAARSGRESDAREFYQRAIEARRDYAPAIGNLAALYEQAGKSDDAVAALRYGIGVAPGEESFYLNLASLYLRLGNREAARSSIELLLGRNPASLRAKQAMRELDGR